MQLMAEQLMADAKKGIILEAEQRRHVIAWLMSQGSIQTNEELAAIFHVHPRSITTDRSKIRELMAESITHEDVALVLADITMTIQRNLRDLEKSKGKCKLGTRTYESHCATIVKMQLDFVKAFQDLGVYPKELGTVHMDKFEFKASVGLALPDISRKTTMFDAPTLEGEVVEAKALTDGKDSRSETVRSAATDIGTPKTGNNEISDTAAPTSAQLPAVQADPRVGGSVPPGREDIK